MSGFQWLTLVTAIVTWFLVVLGGIVRVTGAGLGCPDWPLCYGQVIPPLDPLALTEYFHRLAAALASILIVLTTGTILWRQRHRRGRVWLSLAILGVLLLQILLGGVTVLLELPPMVVLAHLAVAMVLLGLLVALAVVVLSEHWQPVPVRDRFARLAAWTAGFTYLLLLSGAYVLGSGASLGCTDWPLCLGLQVFPAGNPQAHIHMLHRLVAVIAGVHVLLLMVRAWRTRRGQPAVLWLTTAAGVLFLLQTLNGAFNVWTRLLPIWRASHLALAAAVWALVVAVAVLAHLADRAPERKVPVEPAGQPPAARRPRLGVYLQLMKPRIVVLLLLTTLAAMLIAARGLPPWPLLLWTLLGGGLAAGGAAAFNQYLDREMDTMMFRTARRPLTTGDLTPSQALRFAILVTLAGLAILALLVNPLTAGLALLGHLHYVLVYTRVLKRLTPQNIVLGGAAGAIAPLVGWAAVTNSLDLTALYLFAVIFFWTPPHFWALALLVKNEYARAGIPMLPVVAGDRATAWQIVLYTLLLLAVSLLLVPGRAMGLVYLVGALLLGGLFLVYAVQLLRDLRRETASRLFRYSLLYLALLFSVMVVDRTLLTF